jgi:trans-2,3-dihydro-3-hydroxyanthranilate isomerase
MTQYHVYDVFTDTPFGGNQLAVFPDAADLPEDKLQSIAAEFNFSEVTFVYPPKNPAHTAQVRIFTPTSEVDFAGHPTIGTLIALSDLGYNSPMILELGVGPITGEVTQAGASFTATQSLDILSHPTPALVAEALRLPETALKTDTHPPVQASMGLPFVLVELRDRVALANCDTNIDAIRRGNALYPAGLDFAVFAYVRQASRIDSRMFAPLDNIPEDPATGSASATLAALLTETLNAPQSLSFTQGVDMGRPSYIQADTTVNPLTVTIKGQAVKVMSGQFFL